MAIPRFAGTGCFARNDTTICHCKKRSDVAIYFSSAVDEVRFG